MRTQHGDLLGRRVGPDEVGDRIAGGDLDEGEADHRDAQTDRDRQDQAAEGIHPHLWLPAVGVVDETAGARAPERRSAKVRIDSSGDHRMVMALSILGMAGNGAVEISNAECVAKSYPEFFDDLDTLGAQIQLVKG